MPRQPKTYAIGDLQGCLTPLKALLSKIKYDPHYDTLWFTGDLINRGTESLSTLRFIKDLPQNTICVLGNHDLTLLAAAQGVIKLSSRDTMNEILLAEDKNHLITWLRHRPFLHYDPELNYILIHAGIPPMWDLNLAQQYAHELQNALQGANYIAFLQNMMGNHPLSWDPSLKKWDRLRYITNAFTRMRYCLSDGTLTFENEAHLKGYQPWFTISTRKTQSYKLIFGHWAALKGQCDTPNTFAIDSGCVWGNCLTAFCLQTQQRFTVDCKQYSKVL